MWIHEVEFSPPAYNGGPELEVEHESPQAEKVPVRTILRFGIDIDGTISRAPKHFKRLINALLDSGNAVYIITARDLGRREETEELLYSLGIRYTKLIMRPMDWPHTVPEFKVQVTRIKDLHIMIDDDEANCWAIELQTRALAAHMLPAPPLPEEFDLLLERRSERDRMPAGDF